MRIRSRLNTFTSHIGESETTLLHLEYITLEYTVTAYKVYSGCTIDFIIIVFMQLLQYISYARASRD